MRYYRTGTAKRERCESSILKFIMSTMQIVLETRIAELLNRNRRGTISTVEYTELEGLIERGDKLTLRKSQAMKYLTERGQTITLDEPQLADE